MAIVGGLELGEATDFLVKCQQDPIWWCEQFLGETLWSGQQQMLESVRDNVRTAVKACHSPGKTHGAADAILWFLFAHPESIVLTTAPTWRQVEELLWRRLRRIYSNAPVNLGGKLYGGQPKLNVGDEWFAHGLSPNEADRFSGWHAQYMLIVGDEASGIPDSIFEAVRGLMASGQVRLLLLGNPIRPEGTFYEAFNSKAHMWNTISIGAFDTPNLDYLRVAYDNLPTIKEKIQFLRSVPPKVPYLVSPSWVADMIEEFGEDAPIVRSRVFAEFPGVSPDQLIPLHWVEAAVNRWEELEVQWWELDVTELLELDDSSVELGVDVARYGDNETVVASRKGMTTAPLEVHTKQRTDVTADLVMRIRERYQANWTRIDEVGIGAGVVDNCERECMPGLIGVNVGKPASDKLYAGKPGRELFLNLRAEAFWNLRKRFEDGSIAIPRDERLMGQLTSLKYRAEKGKVRVEEKADMVKRGLKSPDRADALMMAYMEMYQAFTPPLVDLI